uniref:Small zinc finger protein HVO-2753-like zinc-binding pocket domain-containing protein n=1 Tax=Candidatus Methanogaster sp. ANME-2c ERB4 TaxID=2759911 RepID=A0A7G9Y0C2_9EURY|nr:hypothetical protein CIDILJJO_00003 [Methanosarcinales archaeon ANME-2c ERB4]QNO42110.1 hypothetical protein INBEEEIC_00012 [Methanosarcinales archaeon ANME-2c ERB4]QNO42476.1 hypothetical protein LBOOMNCC_00029 [Methanosarcinales archaeon ANME-2c ERB4]QNO42700.1 hypothetical protein AOABALHP_00003 [Methanosarcinales archaeon ANME-2c ERB4]QNO42786.1 hypothetical protein APHJHCDA_00003 [Methanosarcinales archaeon ANME-2c ERB4]
MAKAEACQCVYCPACGAGVCVADAPMRCPKCGCLIKPEETKNE